MYNPVIIDMLAREQMRRLEENYRQVATLRAAEQKPLGFFSRLRTRIARNAVKQVNDTSPCGGTAIIRQPPRGQMTY